MGYQVQQQRCSVVSKVVGLVVMRTLADCNDGGCFISERQGECCLVYCFHLPTYEKESNTNEMETGENNYLNDGSWFS